MQCPEGESDDDMYEENREVYPVDTHTAPSRQRQILHVHRNISFHNRNNKPPSCPRQTRLFLPSIYQPRSLCTNINPIHSKLMHTQHILATTTSLLSNPQPALVISSSYTTNGRVSKITGSGSGTSASLILNKSCISGESCSSTSRNTTTESMTLTPS
jgi:hypothetical protein